MAKNERSMTPLAKKYLMNQHRKSSFICTVLPLIVFYVGAATVGIFYNLQIQAMIVSAESIGGNTVNTILK